MPLEMDYSDFTHIYTVIKYLTKINIASGQNIALLMQ